MRESLIAEALAGYAPEIGAALWRLQEARERTLRVLATVQADHVDAEAGGNSIGTILYHVALIEADWLYTDILTEPVDDEIAALLPADDRDAAGILTAVRGQGVEDHLGRLATVRQALLERLRTMTAEDFHRARTLPNYDASPAWVLHHLAQHEAEHRGEIGAVRALLIASAGRGARAQP